MPPLEVRAPAPLRIAASLTAPWTPPATPSCAATAARLRSPFIECESFSAVGAAPPEDPWALPDEHDCPATPPHCGTCARLPAAPLGPPLLAPEPRASRWGTFNSTW
jgi:hypothetical protein